jgi:hypothetical protein
VFSALHLVGLAAVFVVSAVKVHVADLDGNGRVSFVEANGNVWSREELLG